MLSFENMQLLCCFKRVECESSKILTIYTLTQSTSLNDAMHKDLNPTHSHE